MRRLLPSPEEEPLEGIYLDVDVPAGDVRPWLYLDMVASVDGAATVDGRTRQLGGEADKLAFRHLRDTCDAILVGASTARIENYGQPREHPGTTDRRVARGLAPLPTMVVISRSLDLDVDGRLFTEPGPRPIVLTTADSPVDRRAALEKVAEVVPGTPGAVDLDDALRALRARGIRRLLCEGGPHLNAQLVEADLVDELFLTVSPTLAAGEAPRIVSGGSAPLRHMDLVELREHDSELLLRYRRRR